MKSEHYDFYKVIMMTGKRYKEVVFRWRDSNGEYQYLRRVVRDIEKEKELEK